MFLSGIHYRQGANARLTQLLAVLLCIASFFLNDARAESAMRSRVYGFRNTDNKEAMQLAGRLGFKVTIDAHSSSVVVLTGDDAEELTRAYTVMTIADQKELVILKVLASIPDSQAESVIDGLHNLLKTANVGTLLNPPAKTAAAPLVVDVYQGELIAIAAESQVSTIEDAYKNLQNQGMAQPAEIAKPEPTVTESPALPVVPEPNTTEISIAAVEPNIPESAILPTKQPAAEPNEKVIQITPVAVSVPPTVEPNQSTPQEPESQEDFISEELLKALAAEEKKIEAQKAAQEKTTAETSEQEASTPAAGEVTSDEFKKIIAQLMKQAAEEEKKAQTQQAVPTEPNQTPLKSEVPESVIQAEPEAKEISKPAEPEVKTEPQKPAAPKTPSRIKTEKTPAAAEPKTKPAETKPPLEKGEEELELNVNVNMAEKVKITDLIELVGKQLGLNYIYDDKKITGEVTLKIHDGKIKVKDCYTLLETVLRYKGFTMTRRGNLVTILAKDEQTFIDPTIRTPDEPIEAGDIVINSIFTFKHARYTNVQNILNALKLGMGVIPIPESNSLIITDYAYRMGKIEQVIGILDVPGTPKVYTYRSLQYMQASELIPRLQNLAAQMQDLTITSDTSPAPSPAPATPTPGRVTRPTPATAVPPAAAASAPQQEQTVFLDADERTNRVLMIGNEKQLKMVNDLIDSLDVRQYNLRYVKEYEIKNVDASEVINVLNELGLATVSTAAGSTGTTQPTRQTMPQQVRPTTPARTGTPQINQPTASQASTAISQPSVSIRANTNSLLVNATLEQHEDIELVIKHIDVEQKDQRTIQEYEIQNVDAREIVQTLGDLSIISQDSVSNITSSKSSMYESSSAYSSRMGRTGRSGYPQQPYPQPGTTPEGQESTNVVSLPTASGETIRELITTEPQISILETTNSLLIYATPRQHASVALVIAHVDREITATTAPYVVYPLENQDPEELATTLTDLIEGTIRQATTSAGTQPGMGPTPDSRITTERTQTTLPKKEEELIRIIPDVKSYSLIVYANKKNQQWIAALIKQLDKYRPQVLLDCTLVEITKIDQFTFDLNVISRKGGLNNASMTQLTNPLTGSKSITDTGGTVLEGIFNSADENTVGQAFYGDSHIQALLKLMDSKNYGRVLGRPSILVKDNEEGVIKSENIKYVAQRSSTTTTTDTEPVIAESVTFSDYTTGITLTITPHIASEKLMQLEIELDRTDIDPLDDSEGETQIGDTVYPKPLDTISSNVKTWSIVPSGATIILGGIERISQSKGVTKVPILGDIPLVGLLFRGINESDDQSKLYIFVKANIIQPGEELTGRSDIERISQKKRQMFEEDETRFQGLDSIPGIKPNPMHPEKILEDDEYIQKLKEQQKQGNVVTVPLN